jgi:hypothetical protein
VRLRPRYELLKHLPGVQVPPVRVIVNEASSCVTLHRWAAEVPADQPPAPPLPPLEEILARNEQLDNMLSKLTSSVKPQHIHILPQQVGCMLLQVLRQHMPGACKHHIPISLPCLSLGADSACCVDAAPVSGKHSIRHTGQDDIKGADGPASSACSSTEHRAGGGPVAVCQEVRTRHHSAAT